MIDGEDTIYTDGSMIDGPSTLTGRVGYGLVAINNDGEVTAKAFGTPPQWIDSVPGAEAWALLEALRNSVPGCRIRSDCESVVKRFKNGRKAATAKNVKFARLWNMVYDSCDTFDDPAKAVELVWMPAHTSKGQIGVARKGDGSRLSEADRRGNQLADELAKKGAKTHRMPLRVRNDLEVAERVALRAALQLGVTTKMANATKETVINEDGTTTTKLLRDSEGAPKAAAKRRATAKERPPKKKVVPAPTLIVRKPVGSKTACRKKTQRRSKRTAINYLLSEVRARVATVTAAPTTEFLARETAKLFEAASSSRTSFLNLGGDNHGSTSSALCKPSFEAAQARDRKLLDYKRPKRFENAQQQASKRRKLNGDISSLISGRRKCEGGGPVQ